MASSSVSYHSVGGNRNFIVTFPYLDKSHVEVKVGGTIDTTYTWVNPTTIRVSTTPLENALVEIQRNTPQTPLVDFVDGSTMTEQLLDTATLQSLYIAQEAFDGVATSSAIQDAITATAFYATEALASATEAENQKVLTVVAKDAALVNADKAFQWAEKAEDSQVETGKYSAKHWAAKAALGHTKATQAQAEAGVEDTAFMTALKTKQAIVALTPPGVPAGTLIDFAGDAAPSGYLALPLVPTNVSRGGIYAALFIAIGTTWGTGDGSTTFGLPYCPANYAMVQAIGDVGDATTGEIKTHTHTGNAYGTAAAGTSFPGYDGSGNPATSFVIEPTGGAANLAAGMKVLKCVKL